MKFLHLMMAEVVQVSTMKELLLFIITEKFVEIQQYIKVAEFRFPHL